MSSEKKFLKFKRVNLASLVWQNKSQEAINLCCLLIRQADTHQRMKKNMWAKATFGTSTSEYEPATDNFRL